MYYSAYRNWKLEEIIMEILNNIYAKIKCLKIENYSLKVYLKYNSKQTFMHIKTYFLNKIYKKIF